MMNHRAALGVPTRSTCAPGAIPCRFTRLCCLPKRKIKRIAFCVVYLYTLTCTQIVEVTARNRSIAGVRANGKVHITIIGNIGALIGDERLNHSLHRVNFLRCTRANVGIQNVKTMHLLNKRARIGTCNFACFNTVFVCTVNNFVINIGKVLRKHHFIAFVLQIATNGVKRQKRARVTNVNLVIHGRTTHVHAHPPFFGRYKLFFFVCLAIVNEHHNPPLGYRLAARMPMRLYLLFSQQTPGARW